MMRVPVRARVATIRDRLRSSVAARLSMAVLGLGIGMVILVGVVSYVRASQALRDRLLAQLDSDARGNVYRVEEWLDRQRVALGVMAETLSRAPARAVGGTDQLLALPPALLAADHVDLLRVPGGQIVRSTVPAFVGGFGFDELYFARGREGPFTQPVHPSGRDARPRLVIATPVRDAEGRTTGVLAAHLALTAMEGVLRTRAEVGGRDAYLINRYAEFVSADRFGRTGVRRGAHSRAIDDAIRGGSGRGLYVNYAGVPVVGAWRWIPELGLALVLEVPQALAFAPARLLLGQTLGLGALASVLLLLGTVSIARRFTRPVLAVAGAAAAVARGDFTVRAPVVGRDEVGRLADAFNGMTDQLRTLYGALEEQVRATRDALVEAQQSRELLRDVLDNATTLVLVVGHDGIVRLGNGRAAALADRPVASLPGLPLEAVLGVAGAKAVAGLAARASVGAATAGSGEVQLAGAAGPTPWLLTVFPLGHGDSPYATGIVGVDLTERARAEDERRAADASVQQAQRLESLGVMAGGLAHDFNNLLGAILGHAGLALLDDATATEQREALHHIAAGARRGAELTRQLLAYAGRASFQRTVVDARVVVGDLLPLVRAAQSKNVHFVLAPMPEPLWIELDPAQLSQVVLNLLTNAAEAIGKATGTVTVRLDTDPPPEPLASTADGARWVQLRVEDTGAGMTTAVLARIFDPFYSTKAVGRGLGLSAVRGIVHSLGGVLEVTSTPAVGTAFAIWLPATVTTGVVGSGGAPAAGPLPVPTGTPPARRRTVLVVEDEVSIRSMVRHILERLGCEVIEAEDGDVGTSRFERHGASLDLVVLDLTMPGRSGVDLLRAMRRERPTLPVIIASGYDASDALRGEREDPWLRLLQKPFAMGDLRQLVTTLLDAAAGHESPASPGQLATEPG